MKTSGLKILCVALICLFALNACQKNAGGEEFDVLSFSDDTTAAAELVEQANADLNKIKIMYKKNESQLEQLQAAMSGKDIAAVKQITDDLVYILNDGMALAETAIEKINKAGQMNINADFKDYLSLKEESLQKQLEAFEHRRQAARLLRDSFGAADPAAIEKAKAGFKEKEENFIKTMEEAKAISKKANDFAKESARKTN